MVVCISKDSPLPRQREVTPKVEWVEAKALGLVALEVSLLVQKAHDLERPQASAGPPRDAPNLQTSWRVAAKVLSHRQADWAAAVALEALVVVVVLGTDASEGARGSTAEDRVAASAS